MKGLRGVKKDCWRSRGGQRGGGFVTHDSRFTHPGNNHFSSSLENHVRPLLNCLSRSAAKMRQGFLHGVEELMKWLMSHN